MQVKHLLFGPKSDVGAVIEYADNGNNSVFEFSGADYIIIDGRPGSSGANKYISIENTRDGTHSAAITFDDDSRATP